MKTKWTALGICMLVAFVMAGFYAYGDVNGDVQEEPEAGEAMTIDLGGGVEMEFVWIPPGEYMRGGRLSPKEAAKKYERRASWYEREHPLHEVRLTEGFWMAKTPVTQAQYERMTGENPSFFVGENRPVERVSWDDAVGFAEKLSERGEGTFRLPTEAEWEYACRAGTETQFYFGDDAEQLGDYAWYSGNSDNETHPVASKEPNDWGLYDMHGNVWEWCADWFGDYPSEPVTDPTGPDTGVRRVVRGGSWSNSPRYCRSASRYGDMPHNQYRFGFRVALDSP